jgi:twinkle protein
MTVREYLFKKGIEFKEHQNSTGLQGICPCPKCGDKNTFAINLDTGAFQCMRANKCNFRGSFTDFQKFHGDEPVYQGDLFIRRVRKYSVPTTQPRRIDEKTYKWFENRKISREAVDHFPIGVSPDGKSMMFHYYKDKKLLNVKYRSLTEKSFYKEKDCKSILWNQDNITGSTLFICEGEADCVALYQYGYEGVSIPSGVNDTTWIEYDWEFLEKFKEIIIIMDNDIAGQNVVENLVNRLGRHRCKNVRLPYKDVNECQMNGLTKEEFIQVLNSADDYNLKELKNCDYYTDEIIAYKNDYNKLNGTETSSYGLTELLKGWRMEEVSVWTGMNSSGKSTMLSQEIIHLLDQGLKCCIGSFEMPPRKYLWWLLKQAHGNPNITDYDVDHILNKYAENLFVIDILGEIEKDKLFEVMEFGSRKYGIEIFVIDSLMKVKLTTRSNEILGEQKNFVASLKDYVSKFKCHIHLVAHPRKVDSDDQIIGKSDVSGSGDITNLADNVFILYRFSDEQKEERRKKGKDIYDTSLAVKKNREHGELGRVNFTFDPETKRFTEFAR